MQFNRYTKSTKDIWSGRIDDAQNRDAFRLHQVVQLIDLNAIEKTPISASSTKFCILGFACDEGVLRNKGRVGAALAPDAIRKQLAGLPVTFSENVELFDAGTIHCTDGNLEVAQAEFAIAIELILTNNLFPLVLGGGHEIVWPHYLGIHQHVSKSQSPKIGVINIDAHFDIRPFSEGGNSGTTFAQIADLCIQQNEPFGYLCIGVQPFGNTKSLFQKADSLGAEYIFAKELTEINKPTNTTKIESFIAKYDHIYVTLDADVFNSAFAPGVSAPQPLGLTTETILAILEPIIYSQKVISFDIAEVSPPFDIDNRTAKLAAFMTYETLNFLIP